MSSTKTYDFTTDADYTYDTDDIELVNGDAQLKLKELSGITTTQNFTNDTGFTYTTSEAEFISGGVQQKAQGPTNSSAFANYETDENLNWSDSSLSGTLFGGATIDTGTDRLLCKGGSDIGCSYVITGSINPTKGSVRIEYIPNYTGNPSGTVTFFDYKEDTYGASHNRLRLKHDTASALRLDVWTNTGGAAIQGQGYGTKVMTAGTTYIIELDWDFTVGSEFQYIFIDGVQQGSTTNRAALVDDDLTSVNYIEIGGTYSDGEFGYVLIATDMLNTTGHTLPSEPSGINYAETCVQVPDATIQGALDGSIISIDAFTVTQSGNIKFTFANPTSNQRWYNTSNNTWEVSDGTYAQSNTATEMATNLPTYPFDTNTNNFNYCCVFPASANTQENIDFVEFEYTSEIYAITNPIISIVNSERVWAEELLTFVQNIIVSGSDAVKYIMVVDGTKTYHTGSAWSASNGSYTQSNTASEITANIATLISGRQQLGIDIFLHSANGSTKPLVSDLTLTYDAALPDPTNLPKLLDINGYIYDSNAPVAGQKIYARSYQKGVNNPNDTSGGGIFQLYDWKLIGTTVADGYFSGSCYRQPTGEFVEFKIKKRYYTTLPDQDSVDINTLTLIVVT